jgi:hypothetical protein
VLLCSVAAPRRARADADQAASVPSTFEYTEAAEKNYTRALLELAGVMTTGYVFYLSKHDVNYNVHYTWPVFRKKLLGQALELDTSGFNTNFVGHPIGGTMYYMAARSNQLSVAESSAFALGGAVFWEVFGEVQEIVSINDVITTSLAGIGISEALLQLGAFFDRSSSAMHNRVLGCVFAPLKSLNDTLDGRTLARTQPLDRYGFAANEWHQFDLRLGGAMVAAEPLTAGASSYVSPEVRISLASQLVRVPGYDGVADRELVFSDANASSIGLDAAVAAAGLVDLDFATQFAFVGYSYRRAHAAEGGIWGQGVLLGLTMGFQYTLHDYDRDNSRPKDFITTVQPLGVLVEHRAAWGRARLVSRVAGGGDFGGLRPYAFIDYVLLPDAMVLPHVLSKCGYYFAVGGHLLASLTFSAGLFEAAAKFRYEAYSQVGIPIVTNDRRSMLEARVSVALGHSPVRVGVVGQRRTRAGDMGDAHAARSEMSLGLDLGARY